MAWTERYVRADADGSGDGTTNTNSGSTGAWTLPQAISGAAAGMRINVRAGTYTSTTTTRTFSNAGTSSATIWWRGFNTTPGDLDTPGALAYPQFVSTTGNYVVTGTYQEFSNLWFESAATASTIAGTFHVSSANDCRFHSCQFVNTAVNTNGMAFQNNGTRNVISACRMSATTTASWCVLAGSSGTYLGCVIRGGAIGVSMSSSVTIAFSVITGAGTHGLNGGGQPILLFNTVHGNGGDGLRVTSTGSYMHVIGNLFTGNGTSGTGYGVNSSSGTTANVWLVGNGFHGNQTGETNGILEDRGLLRTSFGSSPYVDSSGGDLKLVQAARGLAFPGPMLNESLLIGYLDHGALQRQEPTGGFPPIGGLIL